MAQGLPTMFDRLGFEPHTLYENNGSQFLLGANGRTQKLHKSVPQYLKLIK